MEFQQWCQETEPIQSLVLSGGLHDRTVPEEIYGLISALLLRGGDMGADIADQLDYLQFPLPGGQYRVAQYVVDDERLKTLSGRQRHNGSIRMYNALREHLAEQLRETEGGLLVLMMGYMFCVVYPGQRDSEVVSAFAEAVEYARQELDFGVHVNVSCLWQGLHQMETAYNTLQNMEESRRFYTDLIDRVYVIPQDDIARITDADQRTRFEQTFFQSAERICGCVQAEDVDAAEQFIREQLRKIAENSVGLPHPMALNMTVNRFISLLQYRLVEQDLVDWRYMAQMDFSRELVSSMVVEAYLDKSRSIAVCLVEHAHQRANNRRDTQMRSIRAFVENNATDMNMGLTAIAREFKIKPREAAESFRQYYGESVNDVIHRARVKKAKELLLTTDRSVQDIAEAVGYCSLATMYRAFTNVEGVAPGKLRKKTEA